MVVEKRLTIGRFNQMAEPVCKPVVKTCNTDSKYKGVHLQELRIQNN